MQHYRDGYGNCANINSDFSGDAIMRNAKGDEFTIKAAFLLDIVAQHVATERVSAIEQQTTSQILGIKR
jgi:hypothetical protein